MLQETPIRVAVAAYEGVSLLDLSGPLEALELASIVSQRRGGPYPVYQCSVVSAPGGPIDTSDHVPLLTEPLSRCAEGGIDTLIVPGSVNVEAVTFTVYPPALAFKGTVPRKVSSGNVGDTDVYGAQQHAPMLDVEVPI